ncbi:hypothetical protein P9911_029570 [Klebsiella oxytoca]|uniref:hypothetical protein n=1 Tax=Klebsiella oxytoca TaxID=571 RepID=UPI002551BFE5|nr:hypothetical protein [Klebsiella oxytoca]MEC5509953.1 hypothetical protein [Klebsiella oxytoca]
MNKLEFRNGTVSVGDVFVSSWGYEQTNIGFYQVISIHGKKTVCIRPIDSEVIYINSGTYLIPVFDTFIGEEVFKRQVKEQASEPFIKIDECENAYKYDKEVKRKMRITTYG